MAGRASRVLDMKTVINVSDLELCKRFIKNYKFTVTKLSDSYFVCLDRYCRECINSKECNSQKGSKGLRPSLTIEEYNEIIKENPEYLI